jgi:aminopeptidase YwaD
MLWYTSVLRKSFILFFSFCCLFNGQSQQDSLYARQVIKKLTSKEFFGRGYVHDGLDKAAKYIVKELKRFGAKQLFNTGYYQWFDFNVNTFPGKMEVKANGKLLKPGVDYIVNEESAPLKGVFNVERKDSVTFISGQGSMPLVVSLKRKLTFSVSTEVAPYCGIQLLNKDNYTNLETVMVNIESKLLTK